ncbi:MAG: 3-methyl-2-oxobutanoate hydroxymethyltransferase [Betaproteobacteria bacterium CG2_30_59_46]|nr:MAG: 3-methyl-2-oxobutanoate hydroxymethyltransferase [Betaproteobacteria bacterium CG2_30_59_46]PIQ13638.1 MAG: 3-methyl-2-oxobutanoate hydroxymethyltransferase [Hydrogenophilales bacterium CG18_big_fil_WC_8_21_14_2_50_58_12]PIY01228.1 MAG: 3-methyl-2-oxobutanoate hydroxymethyltransferase [Hydrogenophilales bacterium CG_4_10_14_3_um_filter_58_23]PJB07800.1 MAG: 3-methyl-2-oxobutanoate hydroxymethyltransferase [Hydrogenophilales bacterium CG_4_9_14_3_um_filter_59_35]
MRTTLSNLQKLARNGEKIAVLTCYDASFATLLENASVDVLLVGDSLGMVVQGEETTLPVSMDDMIYHTRCVARGAKQAFIVADMPFGSYQQGPARAFANAVKLMAAGAQMVKLEGGAVMAKTVAFLVERGIPVCGHVGLTPQSVHQLGGYKVQGKGDAAGQKLIEDALALQQAGAGLLVLEAIPAALARQVTQQLVIPTIGIGAGPDCSGQVLVLYDLLGIYPGKSPKFARNFLAGAEGIPSAVAEYVKAVKDGSFPAPEHCF